MEFLPTETNFQFCVNAMEGRSTGLSASWDENILWTSCSRTLPYARFPGIKHTVRLPGGLRVHFPRDPSDIKKETRKRKHHKHQRRHERRLPAASSTPIPSHGDEEAYIFQVQDEILSDGNMKTEGEEEANKTPDLNDYKKLSVQCVKGCGFEVSLGKVDEMAVHIRHEHFDTYYICGACPKHGCFCYMPNSLRRHIHSNHVQFEEELVHDLNKQVSFLPPFFPFRLPKIDLWLQIAFYQAEDADLDRGKRSVRKRQTTPNVRCKFCNRKV